MQSAGRENTTKKVIVFVDTNKFACVCVHVFDLEDWILKQTNSQLDETDVVRASFL